MSHLSRTQNRALSPDELLAARVIFVRGEASAALPTVKTNIGETISADSAEQVFALLRTGSWHPESSLTAFAHALARRASIQVGADIVFSGDYDALLSRLEEVGLVARLDT